MSNETNDNYEWFRNTLDRFINYLFIPRKYKFPGTLVLVGGSLVGPEEPLIVSILRFITPQGMERIGFSAMNSYDSLGVSLIIIGTMLGIWHFLAEFIKPVKRILLQYSYDRISNGGIKNLIDPNSECWKPVFRHDFRDVSKVGGEKTLGKTKKILKKIKSSQEYYYCGIAHLPIVAFVGHELRNYKINMIEIDHSTRNPYQLNNGESNISVNVVEENLESDINEIAITISLSIKIDKNSVVNKLGSSIPVIEMVAEEIGFSKVRTENDIKKVVNTLRSFLESKVRPTKPNLDKIHLFFAGQTSVMFRIGQQFSKNTDPEVVVYHHGRTNGYSWGVSINRGGHYVQLP